MWHVFSFVLYQILFKKFFPCNSLSSIMWNSFSSFAWLSRRSWTSKLACFYLNMWSLWVLAMCPIKQTKSHLQFAIHKLIVIVNFKPSKQMWKVNSDQQMQVWDKRIIWVPTAFQLTCSQTPGGRLIHWATRANAEQGCTPWVVVAQWIDLVFRRWWVRFLSRTQIFSLSHAHFLQFTIQFQTKTSKRKNNYRAIFMF